MYEKPDGQIKMNTRQTPRRHCVNNIKIGNENIIHVILKFPYEAAAPPRNNIPISFDRM